MQEPLISIVVPSLNQGEYLELALRSVLEQDYQRFELIVMDGGSGDQSRDILQRYASRLAYWSSQPDGGPAAALNEGFRHATGEVLGFLNADDFYLPGAFATVARAFAASPAIDVWSGHGYFATAAGRLAVPMFSDRWSLLRFKHGACVLLQPATFFRREAFLRAGGFPETGRVCWDMELWAALATSGARFGTLDAHLAAFRLHPKSLTGGTENRHRRRADARAVMAGLQGGRASRLGEFFFRALKFGRNPVRSLRRRAFFRSILDRWSL
jgi:glycosyltransferase involved in cell wall biosynthesis